MKLMNEIEVSKSLLIDVVVDVVVVDDVGDDDDSDHFDQTVTSTTLISNPSVPVLVPVPVERHSSLPFPHHLPIELNHEI